MAAERSSPAHRLVRRAAPRYPARFERSRVGVRVVEGQLAGGLRGRKVVDHQILGVLRLICDEELSLRSTREPSESDIEPPKYPALLTAATAPFGREPKCSASSVARVATSSRGTTSSTAPLARASAGVNGLPLRMATKDRWVPPPPGLISRSTSGWPM